MSQRKKRHKKTSILPANFLMRVSLHTMKWLLITLAIALNGKYSYERAYEETSKRLESREARKNYRRVLFQLEDLALDKTDDLSEEIYNLTSINVKEDEFYLNANEKLQEIQTMEELEDFVWSYLPEYISRNSDRVSEERLSFDQGTVQYREKDMNLDADSMEVLGNLLESMESIPKTMTEKEKEEWKNMVIRQIIATELYDTEFCSPKRLILNPSSREF